MSETANSITQFLSRMENTWNYW